MNKPTTIQAKICGLRTEEDVRAAVTAGAAFVGFMHFPKSPRHIEPADAEKLARLLPETVKAVVVLVNPSDAEVARAALWADFIQLHGDETPERSREIRRLAGKPVIKAMALESADDLARAALYQETADILLFDAKTPTSGDLPGGNGIAFDWRILAGSRIDTPWMLSGGLDAANVAEAIRLTGARMVDVSSGVEQTRGVKSAAKIKAFLRAVKEASV